MSETSKPKYYIGNFGCQMNYADAERFAAIIESLGYEASNDFNTSDLIVLNSCSVRQSAEDRVLGLSRNIKRLKEKNPGLKIVLTGCMARRSWQGAARSGSPLQMKQEDRETELKKQMPWVDIVLETKDFTLLPQRLGIELKTDIQDYLSSEPVHLSKFIGYVPISTGCDHFCTYCIVPFARGREVCRRAEDILEETKGLVESGYKDITLLGQTVNRWINPDYDQEFKKGQIANTRIERLNAIPLEDMSQPPQDFLQLLQAVDELPGDFWLSFISSHPNYMSPELIDFLARAKHFRPYIHFALQSGSDSMLKRMNRRYKVSEFKKIVGELKKKIPWLGLSTDIIVGFPGESEAEFKKTAEVMRELAFDMAFISEFSPRKGTPAALLKDDIPKAEKKRRKQYLNDEVLAVSALKHNQQMLGKDFKVLVEKINRGKVMGRTGNYKEVQITNATKNVGPGEFVMVRITAATPWALSGELL